jgi:hypothetical protein
MASASASNSDKCILGRRSMRDPSLSRPDKFQRAQKQLGSEKLVLGRPTDVQLDDEGRRMGYKRDFMRRHAEALQDRRPMLPPAVRTVLLHEQRGASDDN